VVVALSLMIILGLFLFERFYFSYGQKEFSDETVAWLQDLYLIQVLPVEPVSIQGQLCSESVAVIGHRGSVVDGQLADSDRMNLRNIKIGNTKLGIERALRAKIDFIEIDLRIFSGSEKDLVLYHDSNLGKLEDPTGLLKFEGRRIEELSYNEIDDLTYRILGTEDQDIDRSVLFFSEFV
jgi:glycerophosphoryl diester phosphodiesterase